MQRKKARRLQEDEVPKAIKEMKNKQIKQNKKDKKDINKKEIDAKRKNKKSKIKLIILGIIIAVLLIAGISLGISTHTWKTLAKDMIINENSVIQDTDGKIIAKLGSERKTKPISSNEIPKDLKNAYVAIEDERFYNHHGVDIKRTASAIGSYIIHFGSSSFGGSTITQQLVKNLTGDSTDSITRKVKEWWKAWQLETCISKEEIIDTYLNIIYVGPSIYGVEAGSNYYFSKSANELTLEECAFLAGINHSPNTYNPFSDKSDNEKISKRTKTVLSKMKELKYIDDDEYNKAIENVEKGLKFKKGEVTSDNSVYSYHTDALIPEITKDISEKYNISDTFATNYINMAGLTICSTQDSKIQSETENECKKKMYILSSKNGKDTSQAAMVIIDHKTGYVLGCTGGLGEKTESLCFNRATQSVRQTGSAIKPIAVLAPAIDKRIITASSIFDDTEQDFENQYHPTDYSASLGKITVRRAVESSQNIPFVEIMEKLKPKNSIKYLKKMGVTTLTEKDNSLPLSLGGLEKGISPLQMAGAYSTIANGGIYIEPVFYSKIERKNGSILVKPNQTKRRVFSKDVAYILKEILTQPVLGENGTATYCKISGVDVAAKTGTTDENYDRWLCGFTPYYTAVTWFGYDQNESIEFNQRNPAGLIWANVMSRIHSGLNSAKFDKPNTVLSYAVCAETGKRATTECTDTYTEYFLWFTKPELCDKHKGSELKNTENKNTQKNVTEIIQGITNDIDAKEPPRTNNSTNITNTTSTNTVNTQNNQKENVNTKNNINTTYTTPSNQNTHTNNTKPSNQNNTNNTKPSDQDNTNNANVSNKQNSINNETSSNASNIIKSNMTTNEE